MQTKKLTGLVVRTADYGDYDRMLTVVSPDDGRAELIARGCRKQGSRLTACASLCVCAQFVCNVRDGRLSATQGDVLESFYPLRSDVVRVSAAACVAGALSGAAQEGQSCRTLYALAYYALSFLSYGKSRPGDLLACYIVKFMDVMGFRMATTRCANCGASTFEGAAFDDMRGALCRDCKGPGMRAVGPVALEAMRRMLRLPVAEMDRVRLPEGVSEEILESLRGYYIMHTDRRFPALDFYLKLGGRGAKAGQGDGE